MNVLRRDFLKCCVGSAVVLGLDLSIIGPIETVLAASGSVHVPTYPIAEDVFTTLDKTIIALPHGPQVLTPGQVSQYKPNNYGEWDGDGPQFAFLRPEMAVGGGVEQSVPDPAATPLLSFFSMSDVHITDKESPAQCLYYGYIYPKPKLASGAPASNSSAYSAIILYTTHVLDAAVQTINAMHKTAPFDFGIALGDAANNTQYNELRWYIDVIDGKLITPSSGAHLGARTVDFQKPYQAAGLDKSIPWYQAVGNHDQFWSGATGVTDSLRKSLVGSNVLNIGPITSMPPNWSVVLNSTGFYMGVVDGSTEYGDIIYAGASSDFTKPPKIVADARRRSLSIGAWMNEFFNTTSKPVGHGFSRQNVRDGFACYSFRPKANIPIKVIVLDDTDKIACGAAASLDQKRFDWLVNELDEGEAAGELMIICAHIPVRPYAQNASNQLWTLWEPYSEISEDDLLTKLHTYNNLILWISGHVHRNAITPQPSPDGDPLKSFWEVETPSLRDFPQQFRRFDIVRNSDNTISIFALDIDAAVNTDPLRDGSTSPAATSRSYAVATQQIFNNQIQQGPNVDPQSGVYNAELVVQLSPAMQDKLSGLPPVVGSFKINSGADSAKSRAVTLNNTVLASTPAYYMASESKSFKGAVWLPYSQTPSFTLSRTGSLNKTVYFKVMDDSNRQSAVVNDSIHA